MNDALRSVLIYIISLPGDEQENGDSCGERK